MLADFFYRLHDLNLLVAWAGLIGLAVIVFCETGLLAGFFLPGDSLLVTAGFVASQGKLDIFHLNLFLCAAAILGDSTGYLIGRYAGPKLFKREESLLFKKAYLDKTHHFFEKYGGKTIILARFVPIVRTFAPTVAGVGQMTYSKFLAYNVAGGILWVLSMTSIGYFLGRSVPGLDRHLHLVVIAVIVVSFFPIFLEWLKLRKGPAVKRVVAFFLAASLATAWADPASAFFWNRKGKAITAASQNPSAAKTALTLVQVYRLAQKRSESLAINAKDIDLAQARFYRSFDVLLPDIHFVMTGSRQDVSEDGSGDSDGITGDSRRRSSYVNRFTFSQPIFSGFREYAALVNSGADKKQQRLEYERAKELLFVDVVEAFYNALQFRKDVEALNAIHKLSLDRLGTLDERVQLGRSRESEKKTSLADLKILESDLVEAKRLETVAMNLLEFYIGESLDGRALEEDLATEELGEVGPYLETARRRSDIRAAEAGLDVAWKRVTVAQAGLFPEVSLDANYYTDRAGFQSGNDWDVLVTVDVPIFDAAQTVGNIKEASALRQAAELRLAELRRLAELDVRNAYEDLRSSRLSEDALAEANKASGENYEILSNEYGRNLVNNLDVLDSLRRYQDIHRRYNQAHYQSRKNYWKFKAALGETP